MTQAAASHPQPARGLLWLSTVARSTQAALIGTRTVRRPPTDRRPAARHGIPRPQGVALPPAAPSGTARAASERLWSQESRPALGNGLHVVAGPAPLSAPARPEHSPGAGNLMAVAL